MIASSVEYYQGQLYTEYTIFDTDKRTKCLRFKYVPNVLCSALILNEDRNPFTYS